VVCETAVKPILIAHGVVDADGEALLILAQAARQEGIREESVAVEIISPGGR